MMSIMKWSVWSFILALVVSALLTLVRADEIVLRDGRILEGVILTPDTSDPVNIRIRSGRIEAVLHIRQHDIEKITRGVSARQQALAAIEQRIESVLAEAEPDMADQLWVIASQLREQGQVVRHRELAELVIQHDRHHRDARRVLGYRLHNGIWMRSSEIHTAQGKVRVGNDWMDWEAYQESLRPELAEAETKASQPSPSSISNMVENDLSTRSIVLPRTRVVPCRSTFIYRCYPHYYVPRKSCRSGYPYSHSSLNFRFGGDSWGLSGSIGGGN